MQLSPVIVPQLLKMNPHLFFNGQNPFDLLNVISSSRIALDLPLVLCDSGQEERLRYKRSE